MDDLISRNGAIDLLTTTYVEKGITNIYWTGVKAMLEYLPSAQPEITHCKECLHKIKNGDHYECNYWDFENPKDDGFCSFAERRKDE